MTLLRRFLTLAKADAHGVLDSLEDSSLVLKQCLREAELELAQKRQRLEELGRWREQLEQARAELASRAQELDADIQLALGQDQEDLARFSIRRLLGARRRETTLAEQLAGVREERERLARELESQEGEFAELYEVNLKSNKWRPLTRKIPWNVTSASLSGDGRTLAVTVNAGGVTQLHLMGTGNRRLRRVKELGGRMIGGLRWAKKSGQLALTLNSATMPGDAFVFDPRRRTGVPQKRQHLRANRRVGIG